MKNQEEVEKAARYLWVAGIGVWKCKKEKPENIEDWCYRGHLLALWKENACMWMLVLKKRLEKCNTNRP